MKKLYTAVVRPRAASNEHNIELGASTDPVICMAQVYGARQLLVGMGQVGWEFRVKDADGETVHYEQITDKGKVLVN